jgi:hypothetical protein
MPVPHLRATDRTIASLRIALLACALGVEERDHLVAAVRAASL